MAGTNADHENENEDQGESDPHDSNSGTPADPGNSENDTEEGNSRNELKKEEIVSDQEKISRAKVLDISLTKYKEMEEQDPELLQEMYDNCLKAKQDKGPSIFSDLGLDNDNDAYRLAFSLGMTMGQFEYRMEHEPMVMRSVVMQNLAKPVLEERINADMGMKILRLLKKKVAEESKRSALPATQPANMDREPAWPGYVHPSYGINAASVPYVGLYSGIGPGANVNYGRPGVGFGAGVNYPGYFGPGPSAASAGGYMGSGPGAMSAGGYMGPGPSAASAGGYFGMGPSAGASPGMISGTVFIGAGSLSEQTPAPPKGAGDLSAGGRGKGRERGGEGGEATLGLSRGGGPEFSRPVAPFSKSFKLPSQVTAAIGLDDQRHSRNRFAVYEDETSEERREREKEKEKAKEHEKESPNSSGEGVTDYDVPADAENRSSTSSSSSSSGVASDDASASASKSSSSSSSSSSGSDPHEGRKRIPFKGNDRLDEFLIKEFEAAWEESDQKRLKEKPLNWKELKNGKALFPLSTLEEDENLNVSGFKGKTRAVDYSIDKEAGSKVVAANADKLWSNYEQMAKTTKEMSTRMRVANMGLTITDPQAALWIRCSMQIKDILWRL
jgi:hypothetical protein